MLYKTRILAYRINRIDVKIYQLEVYIGKIRNLIAGWYCYDTYKSFNESYEVLIILIKGYIQDLKEYIRSINNEINGMIAIPQRAISSNVI